MDHFSVRIREIGEYIRFDLRYFNRFNSDHPVEWNKRDLTLKKEYFDLLTNRKIFKLDHHTPIYEPERVNPKIGVGMNVKRIGQTIRFDMVFSPRVYKLWDNMDAILPDLTVTDWVFQEMVYRLRAISQYRYLGIIEDVKEAIRLGENMHIEFKRDFLFSKPKVLKSVVAFANTQNGNLFLGIGDDGQIFGVDHEIEQYKSEDKYIMAITSYIQEKVKPEMNPFPLIRILTVDGKRIVHIFVQSSNEMYCYMDNNGEKRVVVRMNNQSTIIEDPHDIGVLYYEKKKAR